MCEIVTDPQEQIKRGRCECGRDTVLVLSPLKDRYLCPRCMVNAYNPPESGQNIPDVDQKKT